MIIDVIWVENDFIGVRHRTSYFGSICFFSITNVGYGDLNLQPRGMEYLPIIDPVLTFATLTLYYILNLKL